MKPKMLLVEVHGEKIVLYGVTGFTAEELLAIIERLTANVDALLLGQEEHDEPAV